MDIEVDGDVVERQELLNGTQTLALEAEGGGWTVSALVTWNRGLDVRPPEGDITLTCAQRGEIFATVTSVRAGEASTDEGLLVLRVGYVVEGGTGDFEGVTGDAEATLEMADDRFKGVWRLRLG